MKGLALIFLRSKFGGVRQDAPLQRKALRCRCSGGLPYPFGRPGGRGGSAGEASLVRSDGHSWSGFFRSAKNSQTAQPATAITSTAMSTGMYQRKFSFGLVGMTMLSTISPLSIFAL